MRRFLEFLEQIDAAAIGQHEVDHDDIDRRLREMFPRLIERIGEAHLDAFLPDHFGQRGEEVSIVINEECTQHGIVLRSELVTTIA